MIKAILAMTILFSTFAISASLDFPRHVKPSDYKLWERLPDIGFVDIYGKHHITADMKGKIVFAFFSEACPISKKYAPDILRFMTSVPNFFLVNADRLATFDDLRELRGRYGFSGPILQDIQGNLARLLSAHVTTDVIVIDEHKTKVYHGPIDDMHRLGGSLAYPNRHYLKDALRGEIKNPALQSPGCLVEEPKPFEAYPKVTWHNRISRITRYYCEKCHHKGGIAPFGLETYEKVRGYSPMIKYMVENRLMPPWFADPRIGEWKNDHSLSERDRKTLLDWIADGMPKGHGEDLPKANWPDGWELGKPDYILKVPEPFKVPAKGLIDYKYYSFKIPKDKRRWIRAYAFKPQNHSVVHHVAIHYGDNAVALGKQNTANGYLGSYVPGKGSYEFREHTGKMLTDEIVIEIHYQAIGREISEQTEIGFYWADKVHHKIESKSATRWDIDIPPHVKSYVMKKKYKFEKNARIISLSPHMHLRGKSFKFELIYPTGHRKVLLYVPKYDFKWQIPFIPVDDIDVPRGSEIEVTAHYDNSSDNPYNPDPTARVGFGKQSTDEMMIGYFDFYEY